MRPLTDRQTSVIIKLLTTTDMMLSDIALRVHCSNTSVRKVRDENKLRLITFEHRFIENPETDCVGSTRNV